MSDPNSTVYIRARDEASAVFDKAARSADRFRETTDQVGMSAAQTAAALRGVPAQVTDIVTSLASGQQPLTVFLQQGGQLKDMFGGVGPAARALGGYIAGLANPLTLAGAAVVGLAVAYNQGSKEADAYARALITTNNALGMTTGQLADMAARLSSVSGTQSAAAAAVAEMASSTRIGSENIERFASVAVSLERAVGTAVSETRKQFEELARSPVEASLKLNDATNYLTAAVLKQIQALLEQGRASDAAALAQREWANALDRTSTQMTERLGYIERGWRAVKDAAAAAWSAMLGVGRETTGGERVAGLDRQIAAIEERLNNPIGANGLSSDRKAAAEATLSALKQQRDTLAESLRLEGRAAHLQGERVQREQAAVRWVAEDLEAKRKQIPLEAEIARIRELGRAAGISSLEIEQRIAKVREEAAKKSGATSAAEAAARKAERERLQDLEEQRRAVAQGLGINADYAESVKRLERAHKEGDLTLDEYVASIAALAAKQPVVKQYTDDVAEATKKAAKADADLQAERIKRIDAELRTADSIEAAARRQELENAQIGLTREKLAELALSRERDVLAMMRQKLAGAEKTSQSASEVAAIEMQIEAQERLIAAMQAGNDANAGEARRSALLQGAQDAAREGQRLADDLNRGLTDSIFRATESGKTAFEGLRDTVKGLFANLILRPMVQGTVGAIGSAVGLTGSAAQAVGGSGGGLGTLGSLASLGGSLGAFGSGFASGLTAWGTGGSVTGLLSSGSALFSGGLASGLGTIAGALGPIALGVAAIAMLLKEGGGPKVGGSFDTGGGRLFTPSDSDAMVATIGQSIVDQAAAIATRYGGTLSGASIGLGFDNDPQGDAGARIASRVIGADGRVLLDNSAGRGVDADKIEAELQSEAKRVLLAALQAADLEDGFGDVLGRLDPATAAPEAIDNLLALADTLDSMGRAAALLPGVMGSVANLSATAREELVNLAGGLDALVQAQNSYYENFFSAAERHEQDTKNLASAFESVGLSFEAFTSGRSTEQLRAEFRRLVESTNLTEASGRAANIALLQMNGSVDAWIDYLEAADTGVSEAGASITDTFGDIEGAMREITPAAETLVDAWRKGKTEIDKIRSALGLTDAEGGVDALISGMGRYQGMADSYGGARASLQDRIFETQLGGMAVGDQGAFLRSRAAQVWSTLQGAADPGAVIGQYSDLIIRAIRAEGAAGAAGQQSMYDAEYAGAQKAAEAAKAMRSAEIASLTAQREAWEDQLDALEDQAQVVERMRDFARDMRGYVEDLNIGDMSILSPQDRISAARARFESSAAAAVGGDEDAMRAVSGDATAYLSEVRKFFASSGEYVKAFRQVTGTLGGINAPAEVDDQVSLLRKQIDAAQSQTDYLKSIEDAQIELRTATVDTSAAEVAALQAIDTAASNAQNYLLTEIRNMRTSLEQMLAELDGVRSNQEAQIMQTAAATSATVDEQKRTTAAAAATASAAAAAASAPAAVS